MRFLAPIVLLALAALPLVPLEAQQTNPSGEAPTPAAAQPGQQTAPAPPQSQQPLRLRVNEVRLPVTVRGPKGDLVWDLGPEDFQVYDNGVLQHIEHFDMGTDPLSVVLVVETSSRIQPLLSGIQDSGIVFTNSVMGANSQGAVISFADTSQMLVPFTADRDKIDNAVSKLKVSDDGVHLYDAVSRALQMLELQPQTRRRVVVVVSESTDTGSETKLGDVLRDAQLANVSIYTVGLSTTEARLHAPASQEVPAQVGPPGTFSRPGVPGVPQTPKTVGEASGNINLLTVVESLVKLGVNLVSPAALEATSVATGGDHISTRRPQSIQQAMDRIGGELHAAYTLAYLAPQHGPYGYHEITVKVVRRGYQVRTRPGYYLALPNGATTSGQNP